MKSTIIVPLGDNLNALYLGIREFPTEKIILITSFTERRRIEKIEKELEKFRIALVVKRIEGNMWEELFRSIGEIAATEQSQNLIINIGLVDSSIKCAATCAGFVNGIKTFDVVSHEIMLLPVLKFSYYKELTGKKISILTFLKESQPLFLEELSKKTKMSLPLISYHINGTPKSLGLKQLDLVETKEEKGKIKVNLTMLGKLLIKGYIHS